MRIVITGMGLLCGLGAGVEQVFSRMYAGERALAPVTLFDTSAQRCKLGAQIPGLDVASIAPRGQAERWSRTDAMALVAATEALRQAGLDPRRDPTGLIIGGSTAGMFECEGPLAALHREFVPDVGDLRLARHPLASTAERLGEVLGGFQRARTICSACSAGANALLLGALWLRLGRAERVLVGASDGLCRLTFAGFDALAATDPEGCRPFDVARRGMNLGEGAAFVVLETERAAQARGREPLVELAGWALGTEAAHITQPEESGATVSGLISAALERAGSSPDEVDFVSAHGTGTPLNDPAEAAALRRAGVTEALVSSHKGQLGHTLAAAGALGAVLTAAAVHTGRVLPTGGLDTPDPACPLRHVVGRGVPARLRVALVHAFGFGGLDTVLALRHVEHAAARSEQPRPPSRVVVSAAVAIDRRGVLDTAALAAISGHMEAPVMEVSNDSMEPPDTAAEPPPGGQARWEQAALDPERTRRVDRSARLVTAAFQEALRGGGLLGPAPLAVGAIAGSAFGSAAACAEHCARTEAARGRCPSPILFPNLVPSSPAANAAIYLGLRGPVLMAADLGLSGEVATQIAIELLQAGEADALCAGSYAELSPLTERLFDPLMLGFPPEATRAEGAAALLLEREPAARQRGARVLARVASHEHGRGDFPARLAGPSGRALVAVARRAPGLDAALARLGWGGASVRVAAEVFGEHEGAGAQALALAASALGAGEADQALVLGLGPDRWSALVLTRAG